ncbi:SIS domain-containing protein [Thiomicrorhabdus sp. ZW0627]|uniref:D-sedoheptulose-7-phosphate isomerase n=1 Tax=Thiomicrorhabdus sp. ZW0627 TaxID=3039774 RepID=UPI00243687C2|nr:SIS domain-containing protein [Thiomicrorhabdus sp. ZW0627]MDG6773636.1 SIS domain-containing protein [Thiomicrorhabdus sp. ZW0627]
MNRELSLKDDKQIRIDFAHALEEHRRAIDSVLEQSQQIERAVEEIVTAIEAGGKVIWLGNGGSAADAQHMAAELMVRYAKNRRPLASIALTTDSSILTAHSNDYEFETVFARQIEGLASPDDVVIAMSTSGKSANVVKAIEAAKLKGCFTIVMTGRSDSPSGALSDICFQVDTVETARAQEAHSLISHLICEGLDSVYATE